MHQLYTVQAQKFDIPVSTPENAIIVNSLHSKNVPTQIAAFKFGQTPVWQKKELDDKLITYDASIAFPELISTYSKSFTSEFVSLQRERLTMEGTYSFGVRTDSETGINYFFSRLRTTNGSQIVESPQRPIWFQISNEPISIDKKALEYVGDNEQEQEQDFKEEESKEEDDGQDKIHGKSTLFFPTDVPSHQYFIRTLLEGDHKYGYQGIEKIIRQQKEATKTAKRKISRIRLKSIEKRILLKHGYYEYEISNQKKTKASADLMFSSRFHYFVRTDKDNILEQHTVHGSQERPIYVI